MLIGGVGRPQGASCLQLWSIACRDPSLAGAAGRAAPGNRSFSRTAIRLGWWFSTACTSGRRAGGHQAALALERDVAFRTSCAWRATSEWHRERRLMQGHAICGLCIFCFFYRGSGGASGENGTPKVLGMVQRVFSRCIVVSLTYTQQPTVVCRSLLRNCVGYFVDRSAELGLPLPEAGEASADFGLQASLSTLQNLFGMPCSYTVYPSSCAAAATVDAAL